MAHFKGFDIIISNLLPKVLSINNTFQYLMHLFA